MHHNVGCIRVKKILKIHVCWSNSRFLSGERKKPGKLGQFVFIALEEKGEYTKPPVCMLFTCIVHLTDDLEESKTKFDASCPLFFVILLLYINKLLFDIFYWSVVFTPIISHLICKVTCTHLICKVTYTHLICKVTYTHLTFIKSKQINQININNSSI